MLRAILDRPVSVVIATLTLVVIGLFSLLRLPVSLLPTLERPRLQVTVLDADRSREELLQLVVEPLERRFLSLSGVVDVASTVGDGHCRLTLETEWQTDVDRLRIDAERRLGDIAGLGLDEHQITVEAGDRRPILEIAVLGGTSAHVRSIFAEDVLVPEIARLPGAGQVRRFGGGVTRPVVRPHGAALTARGLTASDVVERLRGLGQSRPAGRLRDGGRVRTMTVREGVGSLEELRGLRLEGGAILGDVAEVILEEIPDPSSFHWNGEAGVVVELHRAPGANAVLLAREARQAVEALSERIQERASGPEGSGLRLVVVRDSSLEVIEALVQLGLAGILGLLLGTLVMRWMLGSWRPTLALMLVVPASLVASFGGFYLWDVSLDIVSLAGLALAAGMLVDNSIVVLEAIERARLRSRQEPQADAAFHGTRQITVALIASFLTTAVVFLPLIYLHGLARAFFGVQAFAIVTALAVSLVLSLSLTPVLSRRLVSVRQASVKQASGTSLSANRGRSPGSGIYLKLLDGGLRHPWLVIGAALLILTGGAVLLPIMPRELVPRGPSKVLAVEYRMDPSLDAHAVAQRAEEVDRRLRGVAGEPVSALSLYHGQGQDRQLFADEVRRGRLELVYADADALDTAHDRLIHELEQLPGVVGEIHRRRGAVAAALERSRSRIEVEASATTPQRAEGLRRRLAEALARDAGASISVVRQDGTDTAGGQSVFVLDWNAFRLAQLQTDTDGVTRQIGHALGGFFEGRVDMEGVEQEILVESLLPTDPRLVPIRPTVEDVASVVPLAAIASIERRLETQALERRNARPAVRLALEQDASQSAHTLSASRVSEVLASMPLAIDEEVRLVGQAHELERSFAQLGWALLLALVLVFLTVAALYESLAMPLVVMITVPVAAAGALGVLRLAGQSLNVMSFLGLILLAGIVVNNAIVLVHRIEQRLDAGLKAADAIRQAAEERYRPILMTTLTTLLGMIPLAALGGEGLELRRALALAVSGGLVTSLFAALFVVPILHRALVRRQRQPNPAPKAGLREVTL